MAINFPTSLDSLTNPLGTDSVQAVSHAAQHADTNDAIEALEAKVGADNSTVTTSLDYRIRQLELNPVTGTASKIEQVVVNNTGSTLLKGQAVYASGSVGASGKLRVSLSSNSAESSSSKTFGILAEDIINGGEGLLVTEGLLEGIDTTGASDGDPVWLGSTAGSKIFGLAGKPSAPAHLVFLGIVVRGGNANNGSIFVKIQNGFELEELHNVAIATLADNQVLRYDTTTGLWKNETIDNLFDPAGAAAAAETAANEYTDEAVSSLGNSLPDTYVPISAVGSVDGVASLGPDGKVPLSELDIDPTIQSVAAAMITGGTHTNLSVTYDSVNKLLNFTAQGGGGANVSISASAPASPNSGDLWLDSDTATLYAYDGAFWVEISGAGGGGGGGSGNFILSETAPTSPSEGDTWFDTANAKLYVYYDSFWIEAIATGATGPTGPMFLDYQGAWNSSVGYVNNEGVTYNGSLWRLNSANSPAGTTPSTPNWQLIVQKGDKGDTSELSIGTITTVPYGTPANVTNTGTSTDAIFNFTLPSGPRSTIAIGDVTDVDFGTPPTVTNVGTTSDAVFDFELTTGRASTVTVGTVTTADYSDPATVTNIGTTSDAIFNFSIPQGVPGEFNVSPTAPVNPVEGNVWYNSTNGRAYVYYDNYWVEYAIGPTGATGPMFLDYQGHWDPLEDEYVRYDGVSYNGSLWILNSATSNAGQIPSTPNWTLVVQKGDKGDAAATVQVGTTTTIAPGNPASVTNSGNTSDAVFNFSIPSGPAATIAVGDVNDVVYGNPPTVTNSGNTSAAVFDFEIPAGRAATVNVGAVTTVVDGNPATVTNSGDASDAVFDFQIPAGPRSTIAIGDVTDVDFGTPPTVTNVGTTSDAIFDFELTTGRASTLAVGTVTTGSYSSQASITNVGTSSDAVFNFSIPQGIPGDFNVGVNPPSNPLTGHIWYNSNTGRAYIYYDGYWVEFSPGFVGPQGPAGSGLTPEEISANTTLSSGYRYFVDTTASRTLTLPASPVLNDEIEILDSTGSAGSNNIILDRNLNKINGTTSNLTINTNGSWTKLVFTGSVYGWKAV